jgi:hypothetical protein
MLRGVRWVFVPTLAVVGIARRVGGATPGYVCVGPKLRVAQAGPMIVSDNGGRVGPARAQQHRHRPQKRVRDGDSASGEAAYVAVRALAGDGRVLGTSNALKRRLG